MHRVLRRYPGERADRTVPADAAPRCTHLLVLPRAVSRAAGRTPRAGRHARGRLPWRMADAGQIRRVRSRVRPALRKLDVPSLSGADHQTERLASRDDRRLLLSWLPA